MQVIELLTKLERVNQENRVWIKLGRKNHALGINTDDNCDIDMYATHKGACDIVQVKDLIKYLLQVKPEQNAFLQGINNMSYDFSGVKYDNEANVLLYVNKLDKAA
ncbi:MAG: hypothetical protein GY830_07745 [Bacteroidetes bacterium]|nr:hypothetical protein [Bacteroidota bacterium]